MPTTITIPDCPVCQKPMIDNSAAKQKNPRSPDWKCSDRNCKFQLNKETGNYVVSEYITSLWNDVPQAAGNPVQRNFRPSGGNPAIERAVAHKDDSIKMAGSARDAVLIVVNLYPELKTDMNISKEDAIQQKIKEWRTWLLDNIYNVPF
jgi:hypothetical protein